MTRLKRNIVLIFVLVASAALALVFILPELDEDQRIENALFNDLKLMSDGNPPTDFVNNHDLICFTFANTGAKRELLAVKWRLRENFALSEESCGLNNSCCNLMSDISYIGLVKNEQVR